MVQVEVTDLELEPQKQKDAVAIAAVDVNASADISRDDIGVASDRWHRISFFNLHSDLFGTSKTQRKTGSKFELRLKECKRKNCSVEIASDRCKAIESTRAYLSKHLGSDLTFGQLVDRQAQLEEIEFGIPAWAQQCKGTAAQLS